MSFTSRLFRVGRLTIAPLKGFFSFKTETKMPDFDPDQTNLWDYLKTVARQDTTLYFEPFKFAVRKFKQERAKHH